MFIRLLTDKVSHLLRARQIEKYCRLALNLLWLGWARLFAALQCICREKSITASIPWHQFDLVQFEKNRAEFGLVPGTSWQHILPQLFTLWSAISIFPEEWITGSKWFVESVFGCHYTAFLNIWMFCRTQWWNHVNLTAIFRRTFGWKTPKSIIFHWYLHKLFNNLSYINCFQTIKKCLTFTLLMLGVKLTCIARINAETTICKNKEEM